MVTINISLEALITHRISLDKAEEDFKISVEKNEFLNKAMVVM